jgi:hypothetical protein
MISPRTRAALNQASTCARSKPWRRAISSMNARTSAWRERSGTLAMLVQADSNREKIAIYRQVFINNPGQLDNKRRCVWMDIKMPNAAIMVTRDVPP